MKDTLMKNRFDFYEVVNIISTEKNLEHLNGKKGPIMAMAQNDDGEWFYTVCIFLDNSENIECSEDRILNQKHLQPTGKFMKREDFYDGSTAKVVVDEKGRGHLKELHLKEPTDKDSDV